MKKIIFALTVLVSSFVLSGCTKNPLTSDSSTTQTSPQNQVQESKQTNSCQPKEVTIEGYGDKGKQLSNCFIEFPGEPSRQDKSYYIVEDLCGQFTNELISNALGKNIIKSQASENYNLHYCHYYFDEQNYVMLNLEYLTIANQKTGQEKMNRTTTEDSKIPMRNMVVYQEDGQINTIYLVLSDDKFISINRTNNSHLSSEELINFAANIGNVIKDYK